MVEEAKVGQTPDATPGETAPSIHLPGPSLWPAALGLGVALLLFGVLSHWAFSLLGAVIFAFALARWIGELRRDAAERTPDHDPHA